MVQLARIALLIGVVAATAPSAFTAGGQPGARDDRGPTAAIAGVDGPVATTVAETPASPWRGAPATSATTAEIMARTTLDRIRPDAVADPPAGDPPPVGLNVTLLSHGPSPTPDTNAVRPDPSGDVGPSQYLLAVNGRVRTFAKSTGAADGVLDATTDQFFAAVRDGAATVRPRVVYDRRASRWIVAMATAVVPNRYLLAVSSTATIAAGTTWRFHQWSNTRTQGAVAGAASCLGDDLTLALDEDAIYLGVNQRCGAALDALAFDSTSLYVVRRDSLLAGTLVVSQFDGLVATADGGGIYAPQGVLNFDAGTTRGYVIGVDNVQKDRLVLRRVTDPGTIPTLSNDVVISQDVDPTGDPIDVVHPGGALPLDGLDHRLSQAVIRNGRLWTAHHFEVDVFGDAAIGGGRNAVRWYELTNLLTAPAVVQSGTVWHPFASSPVSYWLGALMPNAQGHVALGMSTAGTDRRVNGAITGRLAGQAANTMDTPAIYTPNTGFSYNLVGAPDTEQPWGRSSSTSLDPDDDMTWWTLQSFVDATNSYGLRLARLQAPAPAAIASVSPSVLASGVTGAVLTVTGTATGGTGFFDPGPGFARRLQASFGAGVTVTGVTYLSPTSLGVTVDTVGASAGSHTLVVTNPDGQTSSRVDALTITPAPVNGPPVANDDAGSTPFGAVLNVPAPGVLANDVDPEGQPLTAQLVATTTHGSLTLGTSGSVLYAPTPGFSGVDSFTYRAFDGASQSSIATVTIAVGTNRAPVFLTAPASRTLYAPAAGVSSGPIPFTVSDPDGNSVSVTAASSNTAVVPASGLVVSGSGAGRAITVSTVGATTLGASTITLTASDGSLTAVATFTVTVMASSVPGAPQNLVAVVSRNTVFLSWQAPASASGEPVQTYVLDAGSASGATELSVSLGNVLALSATVPDAIYFVRLRAVTPAGPGPVSNEVQVAVGQAAPPQPPQALLATVQGTAVTLQWSENPLGPVIGVYRLEAGSAPGLADVATLALPAGARTLTVNAPSATYFVRLVALNAAGASAPSNEAIVTTGAGVCTIPAVPIGLTATSSPGVVAVRWNAAAAGAIPLGYQLVAGSVPGGADRAVITLPASTTAVGGPVPAGTYFVRVVTGNACGLSAPSAEVTVVVP